MIDRAESEEVIHFTVGSLQSSCCGLNSVEVYSLQSLICNPSLHSGDFYLSTVCSLQSVVFSLRFANLSSAIFYLQSTISIWFANNAQI